MGGISVWIKPSDWDRIANTLSPHTPSVTVYHRTLGRELRYRPDDRRFASDDTLGLEAQKAQCAQPRVERNGFAMRYTARIFMFGVLPRMVWVNFGL